MAGLKISLSPDSQTNKVRSTATFLERACRVWGVNEFVKPIRDHGKVKGTDLENDANLLSAIVRSNAALLWNLHRCTENEAYASMFLGVSNRVRVKAQIRNFSNVNRFSFVTLGNFYLEWMLRDLVSELGATPATGFHRLAEQGVKLAKLPIPNDQTNALTVVSKLRNTFHNRGVYKGYKGQSERFTLEGVTYEFKDGDIVKGHASWDHCAHGVACALKTILRIVQVART